MATFIKQGDAYGLPMALTLDGAATLHKKGGTNGLA